MREALRRHWPEYPMEAAGLGLSVVLACVFAPLPGHPASPVPGFIDSTLVRHLCMGVVMGLTAVGIIYSPRGQQSRAHLNPAVTLAFLRLGKVTPWAALFYVVTQFAGGITEVSLAAACLGQIVAHPAANYVVTTRGVHAIVCAKLQHHNRKRCIFRCGYRGAPYPDVVSVG
jgi:aquaporin Z